LKLKEIRLARSVSQAQLALLSGITASQLSRMEHGTRMPTLSTIQKIATALDVTIDEMLAGKIKNIVTPILIPYYSCQNDNYPNDSVGDEQMLVIDPRIARGCEVIDLFALRVLGDEMSPTIEPGDTVIFNKGQTDLNDGGIFVFDMPSGPAIGRIIYSKFSGTIKIKSDNPNHQDEAVSDESDLKVLGRVISVQKNL